MPSVLHNIVSERVGNYSRYFDENSGETVWSDAPIWKKEDFLFAPSGPNIGTVIPFSSLSTGNPGPIVLATSVHPGGSLSVPLSATSELQLNTVYFGDQLSLNLNRGLNIEARLRVTSASMTGILFWFGLANAHNATALSVDTYLAAQLSGDFVLDTISANAGATAVQNLAHQTLVTATDYILRWDLTNNAAPKFFVNGVAQTLTNAHDLSGLATASTARVQPYMRIGKASGTTLATVAVDYFAFWSGR